MLRQVVLSRRRAGFQAQLDQLDSDNAGLEQRRSDMQTREAELEAAVNEITENTSEEDRSEVDAAVEEFEQQQQALEDEINAYNEQRQSLVQQIADIDAELEKLNQRTAPPPAHQHNDNHEERREDATMPTNRKFFGMSTQERDAFLGNSEIKTFLQRVRDMKGQRRAINGQELIIPQIGLELLRDQVDEYSKLASRVNLRRISGTARQRISGLTPEAVWMEQCGTLNELHLSFGAFEVDGFKVGGFIAVCNAILEDNDVGLAQYIFTELAKAIGLALDKAIIYGTGKKMPVGIVTRLAETSQPDYWGADEPEWKNLSASNIINIPASETGEKLYKALALASGKARSRYASGNRMWIMNDTTYLHLMAEAMGKNSSAAIVSGLSTTMPVVGGDIVIVSDRVIPDNNIVAGYGSMYLLAERAGTSLGSSEHVRFIEDQTVFKGTARYDGRPVMGEAFVAIGLGEAPATTAVFPPDEANSADNG